jgi:ornithine cyclodeaminase/alanine dehydrogenase
MREEILYLSSAAVADAAITPDALREACAEAYAAKARGGVLSVPKLGISITPSHAFHAMPVAIPDTGLAALKWVGITAVQAGDLRPSISALVVLSDLATGRTLAVMDGEWITAARTAAMSALAAQYLARGDSTSLGFIGCGVQARSHLVALRQVLPRLSRVVAYSRSDASAQAIAAAARSMGLVAETTRVPREAVTGIDVVVSSVPAAPGLAAFLDPDWLAPGSFVSAVDLGRTWLQEGLARLDHLATDNREQSEAVGREGRLASAGPFATDLADLASRAHPGRKSLSERVMFLFAGDALADFAAARVLYQTAQRRGLGLWLPR